MDFKIEDKYYTPEIEEFHVGFEYEISMQSHAMSILDTTKNEIKQLTPYVKSWEKTEVFFDTSYGFKNKLFRNIEQLKEILDNGNIRVKYLDKEDIEGLGFKFSGGKLIKNYKDNFIYKPDNYKQYNLTYTYFSNILRIDVEDLSMFEENINYLFQGVIKNKSELKRLLKQLNILTKCQLNTYQKEKNSVYHIKS